MDARLTPRATLETLPPVPRGTPLPRLRDTRLTYPMTQEELAAAAGVSVSAIVRLEKGDAPAEVATIRKLAKALDVTPRDLMARPPS